MIDIHCHPLPAVDDGAPTMEVAVAMCRMAAADGITHLIATPHSNYRYEFRPDVNRAKLADLQREVGESPKLLLGCDFRLSFENLRRLAKDRAAFSLNGTNYLLAEFGEQFIPEQMDRVFYEVECAGLVPILTHPERNPVIIRRPELLLHWVTRGCLCQVTAKSFTGGFGNAAQQATEQWLDQNLVHFFATDAHDVVHRPPVLSDCYRKLRERRGEEYAELLMKRNPQAVIDGKPLPPGPEPVERPETRPSRRWFSFLWGG